MAAIEAGVQRQEDSGKAEPSAAHHSSREHKSSSLFWKAARRMVRRVIFLLLLFGRHRRGQRLLCQHLDLGHKRIVAIE